MTPKYIVKIMNAELMKTPDSFQLTRLQVASHLQQYRQEIQKALESTRAALSPFLETNTELSEAPLPLESAKEPTPIYLSTDGYGSFTPSFPEAPHGLCDYSTTMGREADAFLSLDFFPPSPSPCCNEYQTMTTGNRMWCFTDPGAESLSCVWTSN